MCTAVLGGGWICRKRDVYGGGKSMAVVIFLESGLSDVGDVGTAAA